MSHSSPSCSSLLSTFVSHPGSRTTMLRNIHGGGGSRWGGLPWADGAVGTSGIGRHREARGSKGDWHPGSPSHPPGCTPYSLPRQTQPSTSLWPQHSPGIHTWAHLGRLHSLCIPKWNLPMECSSAIHPGHFPSLSILAKFLGDKLEAGTSNTLDRRWLDGLFPWEDRRHWGGHGNGQPLLDS